MITGNDYLRIIEILVSISILFQTLEYFFIRDTYSDTGIWRQGTLIKDLDVFNGISQQIISFLFNYKIFSFILCIRFLSAACMLFFSNLLIILFLLFSTILISLRWRGAFNGGSDYMTVLVLLALTISSINPDFSFGVICYLAIQLITSYFIAGVIKIRRENWRSGVALSGFIKSTIYNENSLTSFILNNRIIILFLSWFIMLLELISPIAILSPQYCLLFLATAFVFHVSNFYIFGLNRFLFSWIPSYPAVYFCAKVLAN